MRRVTTDDIKYINDVYYVCKSYAETARRTGWSASTVRSYVDKNYSPVNEQNIHRFDTDTEMPDWHEAVAAFAGIDNYGELCELTDDEREEIEQLWKEIAV